MIREYFIKDPTGRQAFLAALVNIDPELKAKAREDNDYALKALNTARAQSGTKFDAMLAIPPGDWPSCGRWLSFRETFAYFHAQAQSLAAPDWTTL